MIFIAGPHGVGKTYTTNKIKQNIDVLHFDLGPTIRELHRQDDPTSSLGEWIRAGERKYGPNFSNMILCKELEKHVRESAPAILITESRSLEGMQYIIDYFRVENPTLIYLDGDPKLIHRKQFRELKI